VEDWAESSWLKARVWSKLLGNICCDFVLASSTISVDLSMIINKWWHARQIGFTLFAYPQAEVKCELYMEIPKGFTMEEGGEQHLHCLKILKNIYGQKQAGSFLHFLNSISIDF